MMLFASGMRTATLGGGLSRSKEHAALRAEQPPRRVAGLVGGTPSLPCSRHAPPVPSSYYGVGDGGGGSDGSGDSSD